MREPSTAGDGWPRRFGVWNEQLGFFTRTLRWSKISAGRAARELFCQGYGRETAKDQMLVNPSTNVSGSKADDGDPFLKGTPELNLRFGARLHTLRVQRELSREELAFRLLVPVSHLMDLEAGRKSASIIDLDNFAQEFKLSIAELLLGL